MNAALLTLATAQTGAEAQVLLDQLRLAVASGTRAKVEELLVRRDDGTPLYAMAANRGGFRNLKVAIIPAPAGWTKGVKFWAVLHAPQEIESETDKVYEVAYTPNGCKLGSEIPYLFDRPYRIKHQKLAVKLTPDSNRVDVRSETQLERIGGDQTLIVSLGDPYAVTAAKLGSKALNVVQATDLKVPTPAAGDLVRAGSLAIVWGASSLGDKATLTMDYSGTINTPADDKITPSSTYLTAWWAPTIAQLPFTTEVDIAAPKDWVVRSEGVPTGLTSFKCDVPIAFPKVIGGKYTLAGEKTIGGKTFRAYQLGAVDKTRGEADVAKIARACEFYEKNLGPFPFPSYEVFDADTYYGIESYSYTLLNYRYTTRFVTHEMGHTYFGCLVPCSYLKDTWNEGMTQYVDSVLLNENADRTLENGLRTISIAKPLSRMNIAWADGNATYMRGAYVMRMLENEIGLDKVLEGLRTIVKDRVGKETVWADLRPYFEASSGQKLDWFWNQWISGATFPSVNISSAEVIARDGKYSTVVKILQKGTVFYRLRFALNLIGPTGQKVTKVVSMLGQEGEFQVDSDFKPVEVSVNVFGLCLGTPGPPRKL
ncbi:MAG: hypothetical protein IT435_12235 [Phycisphaerales bacterium]|nr:hypothetical protein [Phycisphaerales bacterium]